MKTSLLLISLLILARLAFAADFSKGDTVTLTRNEPLYFKNAVHRQGTKGETFTVNSHNAATHKVFVVTKDDKGQPIGLGINEDALAPIEKARPSPNPKTNLVRERMSKYQNPLDNHANAKTVSTDGLPWPVEGHYFTLAEINRYRDAIIGKIVRVRLKPTSIDPDTESGGYKLFVKDTASEYGAAGDVIDHYAFVWFPAAGVEKMDLLRKTARGQLSFYLKVEKSRLSAVGRSKNIDSFHNTFTFVW